MTNPTRAEKREAIVAFYKVVSAAAAAKNLVPSQKSSEIFESIIADYAPLTPERRYELRDRREAVCDMMDDAQVRYNLYRATDHDMSVARQTIDMCVAWLAEIEAELEGDDG